MKLQDFHSSYGWGDELESYAVLHRDGQEDRAVMLVRYLLEDWLEEARRRLPQNPFLAAYAQERQHQWDNHLERGWRISHLPAAKAAFCCIVDFLYTAGNKWEHSAAKAVLALMEDALTHGGEIWLAEDEDYTRCDVIPVIGPDGQVRNAAQVEQNREENRRRES